MSYSILKSTNDSIFISIIHRIQNIHTIIQWSHNMKKLYFKH